MVDSDRLLACWNAAHATGQADAVNALAAVLEPVVRVNLSVRLRRVGSPTDLVDDLTQEVLFKATGSFRSCRAQSVPHIIGWVQMIAQRAVLDVLRRPGAPIQFGAVLLDDAHLDAAALREGDPGGANPAIVRLCELAVDAQRSLTTETTSLLWYRLVEGTPLRDLARRHGVHEGAIKRRFQRAIRSLRRRVRDRVSALPEVERATLEPLIESWERDGWPP